MTKRFRNAVVCMLLIALFVSACQPSPLVTPTTLPTNLPPTAISVPPTAAVPPTPTTAPAHPQTSADAVRIQFQDTTMRVSPGDLAPNAALQWVFGALAGQRVTVNVTAEPANGALFSIWGADGTLLAPETPEISTWGGVVPTSQDYYIGVRSVSAQSINYSLALIIPPLTPPEATRIQFQPNTTGWHTPGDLAPNAKIRFVLGAMGGQQMTVNLLTEPAESAFLYVWDADGMVYTLMAPTQTWSSVLPASQDYYVEVRSVSAQSSTYQLNVEIPAVSGLPAVPDGPKIATDKPIRFDVGPMDVELKGAVINGERDRYTLSMLAGETLSAVISSLEGNASFSILGPDQSPLPGTEEYKDTIQWSIPIPADGTYAIQVAPTRGNATYTLKVQVDSAK
jgi:hypothetical protein